MNLSGEQQTKTKTALEYFSARLTDGEPATTSRPRRPPRSPRVGLAADDVEVAIELHVDLAAVVERDLDLVVALLVADLGLGDLPPPVCSSAAALARSSAVPSIGASESSPRSRPRARAGSGDHDRDPADRQQLRSPRHLSVPPSDSSSEGACSHAL